MRHRFTYDCVLIKEDDGYCASFRRFPAPLPMAIRAKKRLPMPPRR